MENQIRFNVWHNGENLGKYDSLEEAQKIIISHIDYKKSYFNKKGAATSKNPDNKAYFKIYDNQGYGWSIRP